jgi:hypothetical protein
VSYTPKPGSTAQRAIAYLEKLPKGAEVMTSKIAEAIGAPNDSIQPCMLPALSAGLVFARQRYEHPRAPFWYSLTDHRSIPRVKPPLVSIPGEGPDDAFAMLATTQLGKQKVWKADDDGVDIDAAHGMQDAGDAQPTPARKAATARTTPNGAAEGATPKDGSTSAPMIELHMVVRVTHAQAEAIVQLLGRSA